MGYHYETTCKECGIDIIITERPMGVPGGKEQEQAYCPKCNALIAEHMTDGFIDASLRTV